MYKIIKFYDSVTVEYHNSLNPKLWNGLKLKEDVQETIEKIIDEFTKELLTNNININIEDVYFVGSNASYNYTDKSDIDIHIIAKINNNQDLYDAYRKLFNHKYSPTIKGYPVQVFIENVDDLSGISKSIYSIYNGWIKKPIKEEVNIDLEAFKELLEVWENKYKILIKKLQNNDYSKNIERINNFWDMLYDFRKTGLNRSGEFDINNLVFKEIRNRGYLDELANIEIDLKNQNMTLDSKIKDGSRQEFINVFGKEAEENLKKISPKLETNDPRKNLEYWLKEYNRNEDTKILIPSQFEAFIENYKSYGMTIKEQLNEIANLPETKQGLKYLGKSGPYEVYHVITPAAMVYATWKLGMKSRWCIGGAYNEGKGNDEEGILNEAKRHWQDYKQRYQDYFVYVSESDKYCLALKYTNRRSYDIWGNEDNFIENNIIPNAEEIKGSPYKINDLNKRYLVKFYDPAYETSVDDLNELIDESEEDSIIRTHSHWATGLTIIDSKTGETIYAYMANRFEDFLEGYIDKNGKEID